ncbi:hypothetical protein ERO13_D10G195250v2 [Gossypium hirsutum]|uniref:Uncharacterized protein n=2 Tax=Gossypium TaxID=3633 RepID=A0A5D2TCD3_GOSMU|nr:hypothetical protein ERO13_D10G195250v2 [Gossypium hirsutum]TYG51167.1 hypothetical protein ES288_D10G235100v1 [Gossypium darwinii]TYI62113.1 hypothetical protein E1A91_D10G222400v1 [Gossypium mustelinum]
MEKNKDDDYGEEEDSEYVLLDLEAVRAQIDIPPNAPYTLLRNQILLSQKLKQTKLMLSTLLTSIICFG